MTAAVFMTKEQIDELVKLARADVTLWAEFKDRECWLERTLHEDNVENPKLPSMAMLAEKVVRRKYGEGHGFDRGGLILAMRRLARRELGFPI